MAEKNHNAAASDRAEDAKYKECLRNFSRENGGFVFDGCGLFTRLGDGPNQVLVCEACGCHRSHHRNYEVPPSDVQVIAIAMRLQQIHSALAAAPRVVIDNGEDAPQASTDDE